LLLIVALVYTVRNVIENHDGFELNETHKLLVCIDDVHILSVNMNTTTKNSEVLLEASRGRLA